MNTNQWAIPTAFHCSIRVWPRVSATRCFHRSAGRRSTDGRLAEFDHRDDAPDRLDEQGDAHGRDGQGHHDGEDLHVSALLWVQGSAGMLRAERRAVGTGSSPQAPCDKNLTYG